MTAVEETLEWLLNFERQAGCPVVLSIVIEGGKVGFVNLQSKEVWRASLLGDNSVDDVPEEVKTLDKAQLPESLSKNVDYFG